MNIQAVSSAWSGAAQSAGTLLDVRHPEEDAAVGRFSDLLRSNRGDALASEDATSAAQGLLGGGAKEQPEDELKQQFTAFVGQTLFGQLFKTMRESLDKPAYFHGGRTEEIFQQQLDQVLTERMTAAQGGKLSETMYNLQFGNRSGQAFAADA